MKHDSNKPAKEPKKSEIEKRKEFVNLVFSRNPVGAPRKFATAVELQTEIIKYFEHCAEECIRLTISGLVLFCGFSDRKSFYNYEEIPEFAHTIKKARELIVNHYEHTGDNAAFPTFAIFMLKNLGLNAEETIQVNKTVTEYYIGGDDDDDQNQAPSLPRHHEYTPYTDADDNEDQD